MLTTTGFEIHSPFDPSYNCIAFAAGDFTRWCWPDANSYWPAGVPRTVTQQSFVRAYSTLGYLDCFNGEPENEYEKIALFALNGVPTHAARLLRNGIWASKLGEAHDILHAITGVSGNTYGEVTCFMKRVYPNAA